MRECEATLDPFHRFSYLIGSFSKHKQKQKRQEKVQPKQKIMTIS